MVDTVSVNVSPETPSEEPETEAITPVDTGLPSDGPQRPEGVPEKFWDADKGEVRTEALLQSYKELESSRNVEPESEKKEETKPEDSSKEEEGNKTEAEEAAESAGLDFSELETHFAENGSISEEHYEALEKANFPRHMVDTYIAGTQALDNQIAQAVEEVAGGKETLTDIATWAQTNLNQAEIDEFNKGFSSRDEGIARQSMTDLRAKYAEAKGIAPTFVKGQAAPALGDAYESNAQVTKDMQDPRYKTDPAFRKKVADKVARSSVL